MSINMAIIALSGAIVGMFLIDISNKPDPYRVRCEGAHLIIEQPYDTIIDRQPNHHLCLPK